MIAPRYTYRSTPTSSYLTPHSEDALYLQQEALETHALDEGAAQYHRSIQRARAKGQGSSVGATRITLQRMAGSLSVGIREWLKMQAEKKGRPNIAKKWLEMIEPEKAAYLALKVIWDRLTSSDEHGTWQQGLSLVAYDITNTLLDEMRYAEFKKQLPRLYQYRAEIAGKSRAGYRKRWSMNQAIEWAKTLPDNPLDLGTLGQLETLRQSDDVRLRVGVAIIDLLLQVTDAFEVVRETKMRAMGAHRKKYFQSNTYLRVRPEWVKKLDMQDETLARFTSANRPMVVPPARWAPKEKGGYRYALSGKYDLVRKVHPEWQAQVRESIQPIVYEALNALQETRWQINPDVYALLIEVRARGGEMVGVPRYEPLDEPLRPAGVESDPSGMQKYIGLRREWHEQENRRPFAVAQFERVYRLASDLVTHESLYFPWSLDFRGRMYPLVRLVTPQGDDLSRGLLRFAEGKPLGPEGVRALALHGMNCLDELPEAWPGSEHTKVSKMTLDERVQWVEEHSVLLEAVAQDPFVNLWWTEAEKPLQFFAFCCEWARYIAQGEQAVSYLPCSIDGSCNGLQHLAALTRDATTAEAVNMLPLERPQDLYDTIATDLQQRLTQFEPREGCRRCVVAGFEEDVSRWASEADTWITRKLTKRPTMTFGYGSKEYGFTAQLLGYIKEQTWTRAYREKFTTITEEGKRKNHVRRGAEVLSHLLWESLGHRVPRAFQVMDWLQQCAKVIAKQSDQPVVWRVPLTGFLAGQVSRAYYHSTRKQVRTTLNGTAFVPITRILTTRVKSTKQANGISPNVVHSLDAAALMLAVSEAKAHGVTAFAMIHDSYGSHATDIPLLARVTRETFTRLYRDDVLADLAAQFTQQVTDAEELPEVPQRGTLDLNALGMADYFFA